jgi:hypothetical protein
MEVNIHFSSRRGFKWIKVRPGSGNLATTAASFMEDEAAVDEFRWS